MSDLKSMVTGKYTLWFILAIPGIIATKNYFSASFDYGMMMHMTGEFAGRFLAITLMATPISLMFPNSKISIFNRWGDEVFHDENYQNDWTGMYKGENLPAGTYFYVLRVNDGLDTELKGYIFIQR